MTYLSLKYLHLLSMVLLFGTGFGSAFYKWMADRSGNVIHIAATNRHVVLADWLFTAPTVIFQLISGLVMLYLAHIPVTTLWVMASLVLYVMAGLCWVPVVWLQISMRKISNKAESENTNLTPLYWRYYRIWFWLGVPAFTAMLIVVQLMVSKPEWGIEI